MPSASTARPDTVDPPVQDRRAAVPPPRIPGELGQWVFIGGDMMMFAMFFVAFAIRRGQSRMTFHQGQQALSLTLGTIDTVLLLTSSLCVAISVSRLRAGPDARARTLLGLAIGCGVAFVVSKTVEYHHLVAIDHAGASNSFFGYYFALTALHLVHVVLGLAALTAVLVWSGSAQAGPARSPLLEGAGLYWHLVDLLWLVLFPLLYLAS